MAHLYPPVRSVVANLWPLVPQTSPLGHFGRAVPTAYVSSANFPKAEVESEDRMDDWPSDLAVALAYSYLIRLGIYTLHSHHFSVAVWVHVLEVRKVVVYGCEWGLLVAEANASETDSWPIAEGGSQEEWAKKL